LALGIGRSVDDAYPQRQARQRDRERQADGTGADYQYVGFAFHPNTSC
jgi:hypothetical protein